MKTKRGVIVLIIALLLFVSGCSSKSMTNSFKGNVHMEPSFGIDGDFAVSSPPVTNGAYDLGIMPEDDYSRDVVVDEKSQNAKLITNVYISMESVKFDKTTEDFKEIIDSYDGIITKSNIYSSGGYYGNRTNRVGEYTVRVPEIKLDEFIEKIEKISEIVSKNSQVEDVSSYYQDTESRLNVLNIKEERILEMLSKATEMQDLIMLENTLSDIIYQKENLTGVLKGIDDKVAYSTLNLSIKEVEVYTPIETVKTSFKERVRNAFSMSFKEYKKNLENMFISFIYAIPPLIATTLLILIVVIILKKTNIIKSEKNKNKNNQEE